MPGNSIADPLSPFLPAVQAWFREELGEPTPPQALGWPAVRDGKHTLIVAPTGSGKTLAAFLSGLNDLWVRSLAGEDLKGVQLLYVSPLKALNNDVHRNLEVPLEGVRRVAERLGQPLPELRRAVRTGDTPSRDRQAMIRRPPHILITTPESLYLLLTSKQARAMLASVRTVIVDEVHALMESKRGVHLTLSLERLEALTRRPVQRIGLSATVRPLEEAARFLGGFRSSDGERDAPRPVEIVDAGGRKDMDLAVVSPVPDFRDLPGESVWPSLARTLLDLIGGHRSTLVFVNDRRQAERVTALLNELAATELAQSHHGSISRERRLRVEQALKRGELPAVVATSSLELGIDIGSVDLVVQLGSPASVARGLQRVGRSGHLLTRTSVGRILPKHRRDVLECATVAREMLRREIEPVHTPRDCLDVLAQQVTAMVSVEPWSLDDLFATVRRAYPYRSLSRTQLESVVSMLAGRYPAKEFAGLRPRVFWDQIEGVVRALPNAATLAITGGGTIPERGYYPVVLAGEGVRLGELDEEYVFEAKIGDVFWLGSASWRIADIRPDRVSVSPAPGEAAGMPFWHGEGLGRPFELGRKIGAFTRELAERARAPDCLDWLRRDCALDETAALNLRTYVLEQLEATGILPTDNTLVLESFHDELGDLRLVLHSPFGRRVNGPWALALAARLRLALGITPGVAYNDDGILFRLPQADAPPPVETLLSVSAHNVRDLILQEMTGTPLFGAAFREAGERALVLRKSPPGRRTPLWLQRLRANDLMEMAKEYPSFPIMAEAYRECLEEYFDLPHLRQVLRAIEGEEIRIGYRETPYPSPFAAGLLHDFVAAYLYEGDTPRAERHSQLLSLNRELLREVLDEGGLRDLLEPEAIAQVDGILQRRTSGWRARSGDELLDLMLRLGDLSDEEVAERFDGDSTAALADLAGRGRVRSVPVSGAADAPTRWAALEESGLFFDAFGAGGGGRVAARDAIVRRYARTHGPFQIHEVTARYGMDAGAVARTLAVLEAEGRLAAGEYTPGRTGLEWCDVEVLQQIHRSTLAILRKEAEPVEARTYASFLAGWQGITHAATPSDQALLSQAIAQLQGLPLPAVLWEQEVLPRRVPGYRPEWLDRLIASGEIVWVGRGGPGPHGRRLCFYLRSALASLLPSPRDQPLAGAAGLVWQTLAERGALFLSDLEAASGLSTAEAGRALWELAWDGLVTNDSFGPVRAFRGLSSPGAGGDGLTLARRPPRWLRREVAVRVADAAGTSQGRWSVAPGVGHQPEAWVPAWASLLIARYGVVTHEMTGNEPAAPPWSALADEWKRMEARGQIRRGYFLAGLSGLQFAAPEAVDSLRRHLRDPEAPARADRPRLLSLLDPACPFAGVYPLRGPGSAPISLPHIAGNYLVLWDGVPVIAVEGSGRVLMPLASLTPEDLMASLSCLSDLVLTHGSTGRQRPKVVVERWGEEAVTQTSVAPVLERLGYQHEPDGMILWGFQAERLARDAEVRSGP